MRPISDDAFCSFRFLSDLELSPEGKSACFAVTHADRKKNSYHSCLYLLKDGKTRKLTSGGRERSFRYLDEDTILFPGDREETDKEGAAPSLISRFYTIRLDGGEAEEAFVFPIPVSKILPLPDGNLLAAGRTYPGFEDLYLGRKRDLDAWRRNTEENKDYEEITQVPWWNNGSTFTKGAYESLFFYDAEKKKLQRLSGLNENVTDAVLSPDGSAVYYLSSPVRPLLPLSGSTSLCRMDIKEKTITRLAESSETFEIMGICPAEHFLLVLASDKHMGLNTDCDFYRCDYADGRLSLYAEYGESIGSSVGSDIRYGGGRSVAADKDTIYFISTRFDGAALYRLENGKIEQLTDRPGSVDAVCAAGGKVLMTALFDMKGQEIYDLEGNRLTSFNEAVLRGKYVAAPQPLNVRRNGCDVHGFVLFPMDYDPAGKYPVILDIHGGPKTVYGPVFYHEMQYWAGRGYFVIFCNPTGSDGRGAFMDIRGKYGTVDYEDLMAFTDEALRAYPAMDPDRLYETGGSYGGFMTNWIIGHTDRFRACASQRSISNWFSFYGISDIGVEFTADQNASDPWQDPEKLWEHSPLKYADRASTPTLFIHSFEDYRCPVDQGWQMFAALIAHGVDSRMVCFRGENHELSRSGKPAHRLKRLREITKWFETH